MNLGTHELCAGLVAMEVGRHPLRQHPALDTQLVRALHELLHAVTHPPLNVSRTPAVPANATRETRKPSKGSRARWRVSSVGEGRGAVPALSYTRSWWWWA